MSMTVWRAKMNSGNDDVDWDGTKEYARRKGVVGVGWGRRASAMAHSSKK